jgi:hypothetical protein
MAHHQGSQRATQPEEDKSFFLLGMVGVGEQKRLFIKRDRLRLLECYPVLASILRVLAVIPLKGNGTV